MKASFTLLVMFSGLLTFAQANHAQEITKDYGGRPSWDVVAQRIKTHALVGFEWIDQPPVGIALIQLPDHFCAVKFLSLRTGRDSGNGGMFRSSGVSQYAEIELIELPPHPTRPMLRQAIPRRFSLSWRPLIGIGRMTFQRGHTDIKCGDTNIPWSYPTAISESQVKPADIRGLQLAPTAWQNFSDIDLNDAKLHWFAYDEGRVKILAIPIYELPGATPNTAPVAVGKGVGKGDGGN